MTTNDFSDFFSPHTGSDCQLSLDEKIEFFVLRTIRLQIQPAIDMQSREIPNRGFAQLLIVLSIFEMIGKYRAGFVGEGDSAKYFKAGLRWTFLEIPDTEVALFDAFYRSVRCGLYHAGMTRPNVFMVSGKPGSFGFVSSVNMLAIDPDQFVDAFVFDSMLPQMNCAIQKILNCGLHSSVVLMMTIRMVLAPENAA